MSRKSTQEETQSVAPDLGSKDRKSPRDLILGRRTDELVLAFCGPLGSGVSTIARKVEQILETYNYKTKYIRISEYIEKLLPEGTIPELALPVDRIEKLQDEGDNLREKYGNDILAQFAISEIAYDRRLKGTKEKNSPPPPPPPVESRRVATIIDGLKHPEEVKLLKLVYQSMFFLFGVLCPEEIRKKHLLENKEIKPEDATRLMERDKSEEFKHGQHLVETLQHSDFFIRNSSYNINKIEPPIKRFIDLILGENVITPTSEEHTMYLAHSAALRSGCLSRQVGAAIVSSDGVILSTGCNDVPKFGGGLYTIDDGENDNRCMNKCGRECQNEKYRERIFRDIEKSISVEFKNITDAIKLEDGG